MQPKSFGLCLDADGCAYNPIYYYLMMVTISKTQSDLNKLPEILNNLDKIVSLDNDLNIQFNLSVEEKDAIYREFYEYAKTDPNTIPYDKREDFIANIRNQFLATLSPEDKSDLFSKLIILANKPLFASVIQTLKAGGYQNFILLCGSNRQTKTNDRYCASINATGLFLEDLNVIEAEFKNLLEGTNINCHYDHFTLDNIYGDGTFAYDETKITLLYAMAHHARKQYQLSELEFRDDRHDILHAILNCLYPYQSILLPVLRIKCRPYRGSYPLNFEENYLGYPHNKNDDLPDFTELNIAGQIVHTDCLIGQGKLDTNFYKNVQLMASLCEGNPNPELKEIDINAATELDFERFIKERTTTDATPHSPRLFSITDNTPLLRKDLDDRCANTMKA